MKKVTLFRTVKQSITFYEDDFDTIEEYNKFVDEFISIQTSTEQYPTGVPKEKLLAQLFNTITKLQNIKKIDHEKY